MPFYNAREYGQPVEIKDEGVTLVGNVGSLDFTGAGVSASAIGSDVTVNITGTAAVTDHQEFTAAGGETVFNLSFSYTIGSNKLQVFLNGNLLRETDDYTESSTTQITLVAALIAGDLLTVRQIA